MSLRRVLHHGSSPTGTPVLLHERVLAGCWFDLHRQGGCGAAEVVLKDGFALRNDIEPGDWISMEYEAGDRWYLGRVEERRAASPALVRLRLEGMGIELNEVFPGGFGPEADGRRPHRYAGNPDFSNDPDRAIETFDSVDTVEALVERLAAQYITPATHIHCDPTRIEPSLHPAPVISLKFRGEESLRAILKELAIRAQAAWGVDAEGEFFFLQKRDAVQLTLQEARDVVSLVETRDREHLFNRVLLTGDYVYDLPDSTGQIARRSFRWRGNYVQPESCASYGDRRLRIWIPWIRSEADSVAFVREFFRVYAQPTSRYLVETSSQQALPLPWNGTIRLLDRIGELLYSGTVETVRVLFDHVPRLRMELGPGDPRDMWPEPPHDERWELPEGSAPGGEVSLTDPPPPPESSGQESDQSGATSASSDVFETSGVSDGSFDSRDSLGSSEVSSGLSWLDSSSDSPSGAVSSGVSSLEETESSQDDSSTGAAVSSEDDSGGSQSSPLSTNIDPTSHLSDEWPSEGHSWPGSDGSAPSRDTSSQSNSFGVS